MTDEFIEAGDMGGEMPGEGWRPDIAPEATTAVKGEIPFPVFGDTPAAAGMGDLPDEFLGWQTFRLASGGREFPNLNQQQVGSCCAFGVAHALLVTASSEVLTGDPEGTFDPCPEGIYGASRVQIGKGVFGRGDGSTASYCCKAVRDYGVLEQKVYPGFDLSKYDQTRCREWGARGLPSALVEESKKHRIGEITQINNFDELCAALSSGYGVAIASNVGFQSRRSESGFCRPSGRWNHCMAVIGFRKRGNSLGKPPGGFIQNSWGANYFTGPLESGAPKGGFWCDPDTLDRILSQDDSWAISSLNGFPMRPIRISA